MKKLILIFGIIGVLVSIFAIVRKGGANVERDFEDDEIHFELYAQ
ncbi:hypothetical protein JGI2_00452 [Candidatus Kryptobacter tengchongensis]|nr:hypothetical protein JGI2_00452 [Candidatus Kryptobacter tengchongensis]